jgi:tetratricopeptide (TPR) repeat protein
MKYLSILFLILTALILFNCGGGKTNIKYSAEIYYNNQSKPTDENMAASEEFLKLAKRAYADENYGMTINNCENAIDLNHRNWSAHYYLGLAMQKKREYAVSIEAFMVSLKFSPDSKYIKSDLHYSIGLSFERQGDLDKAHQEYVTALNFNSENSSAKTARNRVKIEKTMQNWSRDRQINHGG